MNKRHLYLLASVLAFVAAAVFIYKLFVLKFPLSPRAKTDAWDVEVRVTFDAADTPVKVYLQLPRTGVRYAVVDEQFISRGYGMNIRRSETGRQAVWSVRKVSGRQVLYYRATIRPAPKERGRGQPAKSPPVEPHGFEGAELIAAQAILEDVRAHSADVETMVSELIKRLGPAGNLADTTGQANLLLGRQPTNTRRLDVSVRVLALAGIPARVIHGIRLETLARAATKVQWLDVYHGNAWHAYDANTGEPGIPDRYLRWWSGKGSLASITGGQKLHTQMSVSLNKEAALLSAQWRERATRPALFRFSLLGLPIATQAVYHVLLMVPLGVFFLVILRNVIGIKTFGTFMPVLIALAFRETQLALGIVLFTLLVGLGLGIRFYLERLKLLLVPRLAAVLIVVIFLMALITVVTYNLGLHRGLSVALFPMVIMTMTIERMSIVWEERGPLEALQQGLGSMVAAVIAYLIMSIVAIQHLVFVFPELLLALLAGTLLLGRYSGYRLLELARFKVLAKETQ